jgi:hypothetical protein
MTKKMHHRDTESTEEVFCAVPFPQEFLLRDLRVSVVILE